MTMHVTAHGQTYTATLLPSGALLIRFAATGQDDPAAACAALAALTTRMRGASGA
jgi:hypothetical protein